MLGLLGTFDLKEQGELCVSKSLTFLSVSLNRWLFDDFPVPLKKDIIVCVTS